MKPLHRCLKASLTTILLPIVFTSIELPGEQHTPPGSNTRQISRCHTLARSSPRLMLYLTFDLNTFHDTWSSSGTIRERPRGTFPFFLFFFFDEESWLIRTYHDYIDTPRTTNGDQRRLNTHWIVLRPFSGVECPRLRTSFASFPVYSSGLFGESLREEGIIFASIFGDYFLLFFFSLIKWYIFFNYLITIYLLYEDDCCFVWC